MKQEKKLPIDIEELSMAMEDNSSEGSFFLDLTTGEVLPVFDTSEPETKKLSLRIERYPGYFKKVPKLESFESYKDMEDFIEQLKNATLARLLTVSINGKGAFRRFKDVINEFPKEQKAWYTFKEVKMKTRVYEWLKEIGVNPLEKR